MIFKAKGAVGGNIGREFGEQKALNKALESPNIWRLNRELSQVIRGKSGEFCVMEARKSTLLSQFRMNPLTFNGLFPL